MWKIPLIWSTSEEWRAESGVEVAVVGGCRLTYLVSKLSQPVRLPQQSGTGAETKPSMRNVGGVMIQTRKDRRKEVKNRKTQQNKQPRVNLRLKS